MNALKLLDFFKEAGKLKKTLRFQESSKMPKDTTADHSWRTSLMSFIIADELDLDMDLNKVMKMAIIHDVVEAETGNTDYNAIASGKITKEKQNEMEKEAINQLSQILPEKTGKELLNSWTEFNENKTKEAKYVKVINKLETSLHILEAGHNSYSSPDLIIDYLKTANELPELKEIFDRIENELKKEVSKING